MTKPDSRQSVPVGAELKEAINEWRRLQPGIPSLAEAVRVLIRIGLDAARLIKEQEDSLAAQIEITAKTPSPLLEGLPWVEADGNREYLPRTPLPAAEWSK